MQTVPRFPGWLKKKSIAPGHYQAVAGCIAENGLHTVCSEARCPNRAECFSAGNATFLIMGNRCTRACSFCAVTGGDPLPLDPGEPEAVAAAVEAMKLRHVVITSVTRDDLPDGGAAHFAATVRAIKKTLPETTVETLIPDFNGSRRALDTVISAAPEIIGHNLETVPRLFPAVRPQADYRQSLDLLHYISQKGTITKSGIMAGLGETVAEAEAALTDLYRTGTRLVTIGQYLQPSAGAVPVDTYVPPQTFTGYERFCLELGFRGVFAGPFVRSSYRAGELFRTAESCRG